MADWWDRYTAARLEAGDPVVRAWEATVADATCRADAHDFDQPGIPWSCSLPNGHSGTHEAHAGTLNEIAFTWVEIGGADRG